MNDRNPMIGLISALLAVIAVPVAVNLYRSMKPPVRMGPAELVAAAGRIDAFWASSFETQFPQALYAYRTPALRFDDIRTNQRAARDGYAGYYVNAAESIHVDLDRERSDGYLLLVLAHEYGHHVQNLSGQRRRVDQLEVWSGSAEGARLGVRYELQAECLAGVWAHHAVRDGALINERDAARWRRLNMFSDDSETHGTARQRLKWFSAGYSRGRASACDTFAPKWRAL